MEPFPKKALSIEVMETRNGANSRKKRYPSRLWRHEMEPFPKKALSIELMETRNGAIPEKSAIHRGYGDMKESQSRKKRYPFMYFFIQMT